MSAASPPEENQTRLGPREPGWARCLRRSASALGETSARAPVPGPAVAHPGLTLSRPAHPHASSLPPDPGPQLPSQAGRSAGPRPPARGLCAQLRVESIAPSDEAAVTTISWLHRQTDAAAPEARASLRSVRPLGSQPPAQDRMLCVRGRRRKSLQTGPSVPTGTGPPSLPARSQRLRRPELRETGYYLSFQPPANGRVLVGSALSPSARHAALSVARERDGPPRWPFPINSVKGARDGLSWWEHIRSVGHACSGANPRAGRASGGG